MAYAAPSLGPAGLTVPVYTDILADLIAQFQNIYGQNVYLGTDSADYQWISIVALKLNDAMQALQLVYNSRSPATATGAALASLGKLNGIAPNQASYSTCSVTCTGTVNQVLNNIIAKDVNGYLWDLPTTFTIGAGGTITVTATCETSGNINAGAGQISLIATPAAGLVSLTNTTPAAPGNPVETDSQFRARQALSVALPSISMVAGTVAAVAATPGVTRWNVLENPTGSVDAYGNPAHSITCVVENGANAAIAQAIYNNRSIGCYTNGTTTVNVTDAYTGAVMPISFLRPTYVPVYVSLSVHGLAGFTTATQTAMQTAIVNYLNSLQIGQTVVLSELYGAALTARTNPDAPLFSIRSLTLGTAASPTGTTDLTMLFSQVAQGVTANVVLTTV